MRAYDLTVTGSAVVSGSVTASYFKGDGSAITGVTAEWDGTHTGNGVITGNLDVSGNISGSTTSTGSFGIVNAGDGTEAIPAYGFKDDVDTGIYRVGAGNIGFTIDQRKVLDIAAAKI